MTLPFSQSCENNKQPILDQLHNYFSTVSNVFEIGTGSAQHAVFFAQNLPHLTWHTSDQTDYHAGINARLAASNLPNVKAPHDFRIHANKSQCQWPVEVDAVFTANTTHVMHVAEAQTMMQLVAENLPSGGVFCQYGPFNIDGKYTSESNRAFDEKIRAKDWGGIRDISELEQWTNETHLVLIETIKMPANNCLLIWRKASI